MTDDTTAAWAFTECYHSLIKLCFPHFCHFLEDYYFCFRLLEYWDAGVMILCDNDDDDDDGSRD